MSRAASRRTLMAIFELSARDRPADNRGLGDLPLPSLDDRVEIYLRAVHGPDYVTTAGERTAVREQILDAMADDIAREILEKKNVETLAQAIAAIANRMLAICADA